MRLLYIDIDTLRADHLGCAGYPRDATPTIDSIAADGVRFTNVYASDVPCLPSRTALITGAFGIRNGVVSHGGVTADLRSLGPDREFVSWWTFNSWASAFYWAGWNTASISSFPFRHSATWWNAGFVESMNLMRGMGAERADEVLPGALDWLERRGRADNWFLHVHLWDPHTPYNVPGAYGNPFETDAIPRWHTDDVLAHNWGLAGPHSAQEPWGFRPDEWGDPPPRQPWQAASMEDVKAIFDGYDVGVRYADDAARVLIEKLDDLGVLDDTAVLVSSDHGEAFGELGVYADHHAADEACCHIPAVLRWPGLAPTVDHGLHYHLDLAATTLALAGIPVPPGWDGRAIEIGSLGRDHLVLSQGAWSCQRSVRWDDLLYLRTWHDGYHPHWADEMLFDVAVDPHELHDLVDVRPDDVRQGRRLLEDWTHEQLERTGQADPMDLVRAEGGPYHVRRHLTPYLTRLRATGRSDWATVLEARHRAEL
jgi:arylsulfatase A-like enzyme